MAISKPVHESSFVLASNGATETPPVAAVRDFLLEHDVGQLTAVYHPLQPEDGPDHLVVTYRAGREPRRRRIRLFSRPPYTYALDPLVPPWPPKADCWIGFNNLAAGRGLLQRRIGRAGTVVYWAIDFVPDRFGPGVLTRAYDALDAYCCKRVDVRFEVSRAALEGRNQRHELTIAAPAEVAPMGAWTSRVPVVPDDAWLRKRVVFVGHLVPRQGVDTLLDSLERLQRRGVDFSAEIAGHGPLSDELRSRAELLGLSDRVRFAGYIEDHRRLEEFIASGSVAVAPYAPTTDSFTRYADPSKVRAYMAAGLPVVMTDVPPNAAELAAEGGAELVPYTPDGIADGIARALDSPADWRRRHASALTYAARFDWAQIVSRVLERAGYRP